MDESINMLSKKIENEIIKKLTAYHVMSENRLYESISNKDTVEDMAFLNRALGKLLRKGIIEFVPDKSNLMYFYRLKEVRH